MSRFEESLKTLRTTAGVVVLVGALVGGIQLRDHIDRQGVAASPNRVEGLLASTQENSKEIPLVPYYDQVEQLLKDRYVDPITDEQKLASGAVRGMITSLGDGYSRFFNPEEFAAVKALQEKGEYEGIGADLELDFTRGAGAEDDPTGMIGNAGMSTIPLLRVAAVAPGGPAEVAGLRAGDVVDTIDSHWVINPILVQKYQKAVTKYSDPNAPELVAMRKELRAKADSAILATRGWERLFLGKSGKTDIVVERTGSDAPLTLAIQKKVTEDPGNVVESDGSLRLRFNASAASFLKAQTAGKDEATIDLRNMTGGSLSALEASLAAVAPNGVYGTFRTRMDKTGTSKETSKLEVKSGIARGPRMKLLVDKGTRGMAQIFALALASKGLGVLSGSGMDNDRAVTSFEALPDGSGFCLASGIFSVEGGAK